MDAAVSLLIWVLPDEIQHILGIDHNTTVSIGILVTAQLGYEIQRIHAARFRSLTSITLNAGTTALWTFVAALMIIVGLRIATLEQLYAIWFFSNLCVLVISVALLRDLPWRIIAVESHRRYHNRTSRPLDGR